MKISKIGKLVTVAFGISQIMLATAALASNNAEDSYERERCQAGVDDINAHLSKERLEYCAVLPSEHYGQAANIQCTVNLINEAATLTTNLFGSNESPILSERFKDFFTDIVTEECFYPGVGPCPGNSDTFYYPSDINKKVKEIKKLLKQGVVNDSCVKGNA